MMCFPILFTGHDEMVENGRQAALEVKLERKIVGYWAPNLRRTEVRYYLDWGFVGSAVTDSRGIATLHRPAESTGIFRITYDVDKSGRKECRPGRLFAVSGRRPGVVLDIDGTISDYPDWKVLFGGDEAPTFPHAVEFLRKIARDYEIVYLTARDDALDTLTLRFLQVHGFPEGPVFYNDWSRFLNRPGEFKYRTIQRLKNSGVPLVAGIGNSPSDVAAYIPADIDAYILDGEKAERGPRIALFEDYRHLDLLFQAKDEFYKSEALRHRDDR